MTARPLPEAVEKALEAALNAAHDLGEVQYGDAAFNERADADIKAEDALRAAFAAAIEAEREACAEVASRTFDATKRDVVEGAQRCAAAIRARGGA